MANSALLSLGMRAMFANQVALQTVGQNIANANTPGYSRQSVQLTTPDGQYTGAGYMGKGVTVQSITRAHNDFLTREAYATKAIAFMDSTAQAQMNQLEKVFPPGNDGLGHATGQFLNAMVDVASRPSDPSARQVVLSRAQDLAARFAHAGSQLVDLQAGVVSDLKANVSVVNQLAKQIASANDQIARANGNQHTPNDLLDKRDQLISELSQYVQVSTLEAKDGTMGVFIGGGQRLVLGADAQQLTLSEDPYDSSRAAVSITETNGARPLDESVLTGGSISALLKFQNKDLQDARNFVGQIATALSTKVNAQQALGWDQSNPPTTGAPLFAVGAPRALPAVTNARTATGDYLSSVSLTITDPTQLQASSYKLSADPSGTAGQYLLTRLSDGHTRTVVDGDVVDGVKINIGPPAPAANDSFLLEPVAQSAVDMKRALDQSSGIAAASPLSAIVDVNNKGSATVDSMYAVNQKLNTTLAPMKLQFGANNATIPGAVDYTLTLSDGTVLPGTWQPGQPIGNEPNAATPIDLGFELRLNGVPKNGDVIDIDTTKFPATNNGNAKAFLNLQTETFIGKNLLPNGSLTSGATVNDAYAAAMSEIGARVQGAQYLSGVSTSVASDAEASRSGQSGVNIDEEAARLMQFQQGYQAAAKLLQAAQTIFNELLQMGQH
ncbi:flagellar hook-associated protein FlgK [Paucibacter sp. APW11]|uniref:Flagellar hook-associated protein 1 n=1 Tax=Roseateles aquae TaxID=3077235 RepID=A0ABU3PAR7_9BURK|nr:flagellar hook-associated protein FlgK [Paucibacter sp. APW11]MDT8999315.1 flagellar hook-associated protein FlgK [Paucibacter sp. APW11]